MTDWRLPGNRREVFQRFYSLHIKYRTHPGCVYFVLPELAARYAATDDDIAWIVWLNGNTQNPVTTQILLEASGGSVDGWQDAVRCLDDNWSRLQWDMDRRYQKRSFGEATEKWLRWHDDAGLTPYSGWIQAGKEGWERLWQYASGQPYMGRLSAWSMSEYARILLGDVIPDAGDLMLQDPGSTSHRNGLAILAGWGDAYHKWSSQEIRRESPELEKLGEDLLDEARERNPGNPDVLRFTLESALCTYKSWHKPNRRYPNVYADMHWERLSWAMKRWPELAGELSLQEDARKRALPDYLRCEASPADPGVCREKQNCYLSTGVPVNLHREWPDMQNHVNASLDLFV